MTKTREQGRALVVSFIMVIVASAIGAVPGASVVNLLVVPGMLLAALVFPEGVHSDWPDLYLASAVFADAVLYMVPVMWLLRRIDRARKPSSPPHL